MLLRVLSKPRLPPSLIHLHLLEEVTTLLGFQVLVLDSILLNIRYILTTSSSLKVTVVLRALPSILFHRYHRLLFEGEKNIRS